MMVVIPDLFAAIIFSLFLWDGRLWDKFYEILDEMVDDETDIHMINEMIDEIKIWHDINQPDSSYFKNMSS